MSSRWNDMQKSIIAYDKEEALLVTAAAGSGKTSVIVQRVIERITSEKAPADISRMLIVTFTNSAAQEMKARITKAVMDKLSSDPGNKYLKGQLQLINTADITTIDAYFMKIMKNNFHIIGINPDARIGEKNEIDLIYDRILEELLDESYNGQDPDYKRLVELLTEGRRDDLLKDIIRDIYGKLRSMIDPMRKCDEYTDEYIKASKDDFKNCVWAGYLKSSLIKKIRRIRKDYELVMDEMIHDKILSLKYLPAFSDDLYSIKRLEETAEYRWDEIVKIIESIKASDTVRLGSSKGFEDQVFLDYAKHIRDNWKKFTKSLIMSVYAQTEESILNDLAQAAPAAKALNRLIKTFDKRILAEKTSRKLLEFADVSQYVFNILLERDEKGNYIPTEEAIRLSEGIDEIIIDEYQDTNRLQDILFFAVSKNGRNIISVGDVKQSIYSFRYAEPESFMEKLGKFSELNGNIGNGKKQTLNLNYRSSVPVINFTNFIFTTLMHREFGGVDYDTDQSLYTGRTELYDTANVEIMIIGTGDNDLTKREAEAAECADYIYKMVSEGEKIGNRKTEYGDIVILMRSLKGRAWYYEKALSRKGIPSQTANMEGLYNTPEGELVISILSAVNNPYNDIALVSLLYSHVFSFTAADLAGIRCGTKKAPFITSVRLAAAKGNEKCRDFLNKLDHWRILSSEVSPGLLIRRIYDETGLISLCTADSNGEVREKNLYLIASAADSYGENGGLPSFLRGIERELESGNFTPGAEKSGGKNAVRIMSIHQSKGLEFPIVIIADTASKFNTTDLNTPVIFNKDIGIGLKVRDAERRIRYPIISYEAVKEAKSLSMKDEELRILYVAMTRAMEKLCIFMSFPDTDKTIAKVAADTLGDISAARDADNAASWIIAALLKSTESKMLMADAVTKENRSSGAVITVKNAKSVYVADENIAGTTGDETFKEPSEEIIERLLAEYKFKKAVDIPSKLTATQIKNTLKTEELIDESAVKTKKHIKGRKPDFWGKAGLSGAERGTALHNALQYIDYNKCLSIENTKTELDRLLDMKFISAEQRSAVSPDLIYLFLESPLGKRLRSSKEIKREFKFSLVVPAYQYYPELHEDIYRSETILLQGIIDCLFFEDENIVVVDYKTDKIPEDEDPYKYSEIYRTQIEAYSFAVKNVFGIEAKECWIYYISEKKAVKI